MNDPHTLSEEMMFRDAPRVESIVENCNGMLDHFIATVRHHREQPGGGICPPYCWGEHFRYDLSSIISETPGDAGINLCMEMLHLAVSRLAGYDTR